MGVDGKGGEGGGYGVYAIWSECRRQGDADGAVRCGVMARQGKDKLAVDEEQAKESGGEEDTPSEYNRSCISGWFFSSHSLHFFTVPPNSQY